MSSQDELIAIRLELKGQREAISGLKSVDKAQKGIGTSTTATGVAAEKAEKKTSRLSRAYASLGRTAKWGFGILGVTGVLAFKSAIDKTAELSKATSGLSRNFGFQTNVASRWASLAHARDIDIKALSMSFGTLGSKMVEAGRKGGTALTPFHQLGMTQEEVVRGSKDLEWGLMRVTKALGDMEGGAKRTTAAKAVLGKGFLTVGPLMSEGTKGLKEQLHWADKYGSLLDTKTNDSIMEMVTAQRENKAAMFGLQVQIASHFAPAIVAASDVFQRFVAMLNSDDLTADQKLHRIEQQFLGIEDTLIDIVTAALPKIAEHGGELGVKLAGAVWSGFTHSGLEGKLVITAWLLHFMGGGVLIRSTAGTVGKWIAWGLFSTLMPTLAAEFAITGSFGLMLKARWAAFGTMGAMLGRVMGAGIVLGIILVIPGLKEKIRDTILGEELDATDRESLATKLSEEGWNVLPFGMNGDILKAIDPAGKMHVFHNHHHYGAAGNTSSWQDKVTGRGRRTRHDHDDHRLPRSSFHRRQSNDAPRLPPRTAFSAWGQGGRPNPRPIVLQVDGKVLAEITAKEVAAAEALS